MPVHHVYLGSYANAGEPGIHHCTFDTASGTFKHLGALAGIHDPSFLALHPKGHTLYAVGEGGDAGSLFAISRDAGSGALGKVVNHMPAQGVSPCHVSVLADGSCAFVANYTSGSVTAYILKPDGALSAISDHHQHTGSGSNTARQERAHAHCARLSPDGKFLIVPDLGIDTWLVYRIDAKQGKLLTHGMTFANSGHGPRHIAFHPNGRLSYGINELISSITVMAWDGGRGELRELQTISTLPADFAGESYCAEVCVSPNGKYVYGSNRGHNSLACFAVQADGTLKLLEIEPTRGDWPRNFAITPDGNWLLAANQHSGDVQVFKIAADGRLQHHGLGISVPKPVCVLIVP